VNELKPFLDKNRIEAGCDEAGRGCLSGPVVAAAVILDQESCIKGLNDSKKLNEKKRQELRFEIEEKALSYAVALVEPKKIDEINILNASILAMHLAIEKLTVIPEWLLIDGNRFHPYRQIPYNCIIKGDGKFQSIAAASILAKTYRDEIMLSLHEKFPQYGWNKNMGYPTKKHRSAIEQYGTTQHHRMSFKLLPDPKQLSIFD
jgi:ribonuclease HII